MDGVRLNNEMGEQQWNLFGGEGLAGEVVTTRIEASLYETRVETQKVLHLHARMRRCAGRDISTYLLLLDDLCHVSLFRCVEL